jgi:hypothetical protein
VRGRPGGGSGRTWGREGSPTTTPGSAPAPRAAGPVQLGGERYRARSPDGRPGRGPADHLRAGRAGHGQGPGGAGAGAGPGRALLAGRVLRGRVHGEPEPPAAVPERLLQVGLRLLGGRRRAVHLRGAAGGGDARVGAGDPGHGRPRRRQGLHGGGGRAPGPAAGSAAARRHGAAGSGPGQGAVPERGHRPAAGRHLAGRRAEAPVAGVPGADRVPAGGVRPLPGRGAAPGRRRRGGQGHGRGPAGHGHLGRAGRRCRGTARAVRLRRCRRVPGGAGRRHPHRGGRDRTPERPGRRRHRGCGQPGAPFAAFD